MPSDTHWPRPTTIEHAGAHDHDGRTPAASAQLCELAQDAAAAPAAIEVIGDDHPELWLPATALAAITRVARGDGGDVVSGGLRAVLDHGSDPAAHSFVADHLRDRWTVVVPIGPDLAVELGCGREAVGLLLARLWEERGRREQAVDTLRRITPSAHAKVQLARLYCAADRNGDVIELTNGVHDADDLAAVLLTYRATALARVGMFEAAKAGFRSVLRSRARRPGIRHFTLRQRAEAYAGEGRTAQARRDLLRILAEDATVDGVRDQLAGLGGD